MKLALSAETYREPDAFKIVLPFIKGVMDLKSSLKFCLEIMFISFPKMSRSPSSIPNVLFEHFVCAKFLKVVEGKMSILLMP